MADEFEFMPGHHAAEVGASFDGKARDGFLLHADADSAFVVFVDFLEFAGLFAAAGGHAVVALGVGARVVVDFEFVVGDGELVLGGAYGDVGKNCILGFEVFVGHLEAVVPEGDFTAAEGLHLFPILYFFDIFAAAVYFRILDFVEMGGIGMGGGSVGENEFVAIFGGFEEVEDAFFLHEAGYEGEVGFAVLDAVVAFFERSLNFVGGVDAGEDLFQDFRDGHLLEDAALVDAGEKPEKGDNFEAIGGVVEAASAAGGTIDDAVEVAKAGVVESMGDRHRLADEFREIDAVGVAGEGFNFVGEESGYRFAATNGANEQDIIAERGGKDQSSIFLRHFISHTEFPFSLVIARTGSKNPHARSGLRSWREGGGWEGA